MTTQTRHTRSVVSRSEKRARKASHEWLETKTETMAGALNICAVEYLAKAEESPSMGKQYLSELVKLSRNVESLTNPDELKYRLSTLTDLAIRANRSAIEDKDDKSAASALIYSLVLANFNADISSAMHEQSARYKLEAYASRLEQAERLDDKGSLAAIEKSWNTGFDVPFDNFVEAQASRSASATAKLGYAVVSRATRPTTVVGASLALVSAFSSSAAAADIIQGNSTDFTAPPAAVSTNFNPASVSTIMTGEIITVEAPRDRSIDMITTEIKQPLDSREVITAAAPRIKPTVAHPANKSQSKQAPIRIAPASISTADTGPVSAKEPVRLTTPNISGSEATISVEAPEPQELNLSKLSADELIEHQISQGRIQTASVLIRQEYGDGEVVIPSLSASNALGQVKNTYRDQPNSAAVKDIAYLQAVVWEPGVIDNLDDETVADLSGGKGASSLVQVFQARLDDDKTNVYSKDQSATIANLAGKIMNTLKTKQESAEWETRNRPKTAQPDAASATESEEAPEKNVPEIVNPERPDQPIAGEEVAEPKPDSAPKVSLEILDVNPEIEAAERMIARGGEHGEWAIRGEAMKFYLASERFTAQEASGMIGNFEIEAPPAPGIPGFSSETIQWGGKGHGRGICQWGNKDNPAYDRFGYDGKRGLALFASQQGKDWTDLNVQFEFTLHEFDNGESDAYKRLKEANSPEEAAYLFGRYYERPADLNASLPQRQARAALVYNAYTEELATVNAEIEDAKKAQEQAQDSTEADIAQVSVETGWDGFDNMPSGKRLLDELKAKYDGVSGRLSADELEVINSDIWSNARLHPAAAAGMRALNEAYKAEFGKDISFTDNYRDLEDQKICYNSKKKITSEGVHMCATPGTSNHGWGMAVDFSGGINDFGTKEHIWMDENSFMYGYVHPSWAHSDGEKPEPWHFEYAGKDATRSESTGVAESASAAESTGGAEIKNANVEKEQDNTISSFFEKGTNYTISSPFGPRIDPITGAKGHDHGGVDFAVPVGTPLVAPARAEIVAMVDAKNSNEIRKSHFQSGKVVILKLAVDHPEYPGAYIGMDFGHLNAFADGLKEGDIIEPGTVFAYSGNSGNSTGAHVHTNYIMIRSGSNDDYNPFRDNYNVLVAYDKLGNGNTI